MIEHFSGLVEISGWGAMVQKSNILKCHQSYFKDSGFQFLVFNGRIIKLMTTESFRRKYFIIGALRMRKTGLLCSSKCHWERDSTRAPCAVIRLYWMDEWDEMIY